MPGWRFVADWMAYDHLDDGSGLSSVFVLAYKITDDGSDHWTSRFSRYKNRDRTALAGAKSTFRVGVPRLVEALNLVVDRTVFVSALSSGETKASENSFNSILARKCAEFCDASLDLDALSKQTHRPIHGIYNATARGEELDKAAYVAKRLPGFDTLVIVDDLVTRGGTMSRIAQAVRAVNPHIEAVYGVALGKTERRSYWGNLTNEHVSHRWDDLWHAGEQRYVTRRAGGSQ